MKKKKEFLVAIKFELNGYQESDYICGVVFGAADRQQAFNHISNKLKKGDKILKSWVFEINEDNEFVGEI